MKQLIRAFACGAFAASFSLCQTAQAGVTLSVDNVTTPTSTTWAGSPAGSLAQSIMVPNSKNSFDGGVSSGIIFKSASSFNLGAIEIFQSGVTAGDGNFNLSMYNFGSSYVLPGGNPLYTFTGSEVNLLTPGVAVLLPNASQFSILTFSGADTIAINAGDSYLFLLTAVDGTSNLGWNRGPSTQNQGIAVNSVVAGGAGTVVNNGGTAQNRTPIAAFFAIPEPATGALFGMAALIGTFLRRRKA